jgi:hypothetical protein
MVIICKPSIFSTSTVLSGSSAVFSSSCGFVKTKVTKVTAQLPSSRLVLSSLKGFFELKTLLCLEELNNLNPVLLV